MFPGRTNLGGALRKTEGKSPSNLGWHGDPFSFQNQVLRTDQKPNQISKDQVIQCYDFDGTTAGVFLDVPHVSMTAEAFRSNRLVFPPSSLSVTSKSIMHKAYRPFALSNWSVLLMLWGYYKLSLISIRYWDMRDSHWIPQSVSQLPRWNTCPDISQILSMNIHEHTPQCLPPPLQTAINHFCWSVILPHMDCGMIIKYHMIVSRDEHQWSSSII